MHRRPKEDLEEVWALVDELEDLSVRLRQAADRAMVALRKAEEKSDADQ